MKKKKSLELGLVWWDVCKQQSEEEEYAVGSGDKKETRLEDAGCAPVYVENAEAVGDQGSYTKMGRPHLHQLVVSSRDGVGGRERRRTNNHKQQSILQLQPCQLVKQQQSLPQLHCQLVVSSREGVGGRERRSNNAFSNSTCVVKVGVQARVRETNASSYISSGDTRRASEANNNRESATTSKVVCRSSCCICIATSQETAWEAKNVQANARQNWR